MAETKKFKDIPINQVFTFNNLQYKKITEERISCCRALNAASVTDPNQKIQVLPLEEVTVEINNN